MIPPIGAGVWVEFEQGDPDYPIWVGCFWGLAPTCRALASPRPPPTPEHRHADDRPEPTVLISDLPGPTRRHHAEDRRRAPRIMVNDTGITIPNGKGASIVMIGPPSTVNVGALAVT